MKRSLILPWWLVLPLLSAEPATVGHPSFLSPHARPIALHQGLVYVANTPADTVYVIHAKTKKVVSRIPVGIDPVSLAVRPDGAELWVANHISDSVSVIDIEPDSPSRFQILATVQQFDLETRSTLFDEPVGIAFAGSDKAYVALSSENKIAVVNTRSRRIDTWLTIPAQDPRAIVVRGERLYVIPFESNNQTQLSGGYKLDGDLVTFNAHEHSIANNNVLSLGHVLDIIKHPRVPDRDLFVFDTRTDQRVATVSGLGTLLYGLAVDRKGTVYMAQTDARNDANGRSGTKKHDLSQLENRPFLNRITRVDFDGDRAAPPEFIELEPLPPEHPRPDDALATPFAIQVSENGELLVATAASSDKLFTVDAESGDVLGQVPVGSVPRGIALDEDANGRARRAWVLNAVGNTVSLVDLEDPALPRQIAHIELEDPTHPTFKRGRMAFNSAKASSTATFACAGCHPDGHTDQLLWVLQTPIVTGGDQIQPRSTMPLRGLRETAPFHWDGIPGDPYGGNNSANIRGHVDPNCEVDDPASATRHVTDGSLASTMLRVGDKTTNDEGKAGLLSAAERDDLAEFLLNIPYPPAQRRAYDNRLSGRAARGFELFHILGNHEDKPAPNVCGDCHRMPFWVSSNTPGSGMDAPTWRGAYDRFLILPQGRLNIIDFDFYRRVAEQGIPEEKMWQFSWRNKRRFDPVWNMVLEGSTGVSGSFGRQFTLHADSADDPLAKDLLPALETAAEEQAVVLRVDGVFPDTREAVRLQFAEGSYAALEGKERFTRAQLLEAAKAGRFVGTFTARHGNLANLENPQPALWTLGPIHAQRGRQAFPVLHGDERSMTVNGRHIHRGAFVIVNGRRVDANVELGASERVTIRLAELPEEGIHFLQVQNPNGLFSNDFIFHVAADAEVAKALDPRRSPQQLRRTLSNAIGRGDLNAVRRLLTQGAPLHSQHPEHGMTPLSNAALHGHKDIAELLIKRGAKVDHTNRDGNTPLHVATFLCRTDVVELLLSNQAPIHKRNHRRETSVDVVSGDWSEGLAAFYTGIAQGSGFEIDLKEIQRLRPVLAKKLRERATED